ncbi:GntR family transcriptional regulator [Chroococcidiopsis cubana SAG 39.79]|uniref:GntR family transcriptional regulator n=2 Tax=Chroococcidiopsis TaxID=54298 RepID=A0AB37UED5_9CYAN|nr:PLP-dependent aminotransferase family protein [Chroococcidiopsis cubana CCALA 043]RUT07412.1 GntR family transcriptional regulator [Chroococcidiopsis cubana SAG 39.79]
MLAGIDLDRASSMPLYLQLYESIRSAILSGQLEAGIRLPSTRDFAASLGVSRNTVASAFEQLFAEGYITGKVGAGTYVAQIDNATASSPSFAQPDSTQLPCNLSQRGMKMLALRETIFRYRHDPVRAFRPGVPALDRFPVEIWSKLMAQHWRYAQPDLLSYGDPCGYRPLRECIAEYLRLSRAMRCKAEQVIIVSGSQQALDITARVLLDPGDAAWMEDPGYIGARNVFLSAGIDLVPIPIDEQGLNLEVGKLKCPDAKLAYITPSHQFPLGYTMSLARRLELLRWARQSGSWIIEDDYDSEYRYQSQPLAALQGLDDSGRAIYMGTFSKVLFPALRLGYLVVPPELVDVFAAARAVCDRHSPLFEQAVLTDFITEGHFNRHLRRMRVLYAQRQAALVGAAQPLKRWLKVPPCQTGMHLIGWLPEGVDDRAVSGQLALQGIIAPPLSAYRLEPSRQAGLVLGYAAFDTKAIADAIEQTIPILKEIVENLSSPNSQDPSYFSATDALLSAS